jgi:hypothetical protein
MTRWVWVSTCLLVTGCGATTPPSGTGARETVLAYYQAIVRQEWNAAHAVLDSTTRARCDASRFADLAKVYRGGLPFEPTTVQVTACEEQGERAVAHVVLIGRPSAHQRFKDTAILRYGPDGWGVLLSSNFGMPRRR